MNPLSVMLCYSKWSAFKEIKREYCEDMLDAQSIDDLKAWFAAYVAGFRSEDVKQQCNFDLKKEHTWRVCAETVSLGRRLGLSAEQLRLAKITALFHDLGRFEQYARYGIFPCMPSSGEPQRGVLCPLK